MDSASSSVSMEGRDIFLIITEFPDIDIETFLFEILFSSKTIFIVSITAAESIIVPSTIASWGSTS